MNDAVSTAQDAPSRPGLLTVILIFIVLIGAGGTLGSVVAFAGMFKSRAQVVEESDASKTMIGKLTGQADDEKLVQLQREMAGAMYDATASLRPLSIPMTILNMLLSFGLFFCAGALLARKPWARQWLLIGCLVNIPHELLRFWYLQKVSASTSAVMLEWMTKMNAAQGAANPAAADIARWTSITTTALYAAMAVGFLLLYLLTAMYLRRPRVIAVCDSPR